MAGLMRMSPARFLLLEDRKSTRLNSSHQIISYAVFCLKKKNTHNNDTYHVITGSPTQSIENNRSGRHSSTPDPSPLPPILRCPTTAYPLQYSVHPPHPA